MKNIYDKQKRNWLIEGLVLLKFLHKFWSWVYHIGYDVSLGKNINVGSACIMYRKRISFNNWSQSVRSLFLCQLCINGGENRNVFLGLKKNRFW